MMKWWFVWPDWVCGGGFVAIVLSKARSLSARPLIRSLLWVHLGVLLHYISSF